jgi:transcription elongation factor
VAKTPTYADASSPSWDQRALAWGDAYEIYFVDGQWQAWREGAADEDILTGSTPDELNTAIRAYRGRDGTT